MADHGLVSVGMVYDNQVGTNFCQSWTGLLMFDMQNAGLLAHESGLISVRFGTDGIVAARNTVTQRFLRGGAEWLMWVDTDMGWAPDGMYRLWKHAHPKERPIVGGLCFASRESGSDGVGGYYTVPRPTIFEWREHEGVMKFCGRIEYPVNELIQCEATGGAFLLVHRSVYERMDEAAVAKDRPAGHWYDRMRGTDGELLGEDISFCAKAGELHIPIHIDTSVKTNHLKPQWVSELQFWRTHPVPPATEATCVIVHPSTAGYAQPFIDSLVASSGRVRAIAACSGDVATAWKDAGAEVVDRLDDLPDATWLFLAHEDARFTPGWLDHAQHIAALRGASVVGTNDLTAGGVDGTSSEQFLVRRDTITDLDNLKLGDWVPALGSIVKREPLSTNPAGVHGA